MAGRPSEFTEEVGERICQLIATTPRGLDFICTSNDDLPHASTVHRWLGAHKPFRESYLRARECQADLIFDECLEIADDASGDVRVIGGGEEQEPREVCNTEFVQRAKLRIDTRMRMAGKLAPKKYGDKLEIDAHVDSNLRVISADPMTDEEWEARFGSGVGAATGTAEGAD